VVVRLGAFAGFETDPPPANNQNHESENIDRLLDPRGHWDRFGDDNLYEYGERRGIRHFSKILSHGGLWHGDGRRRSLGHVDESILDDGSDGLLDDHDTHPE
jgi:hypothetical protein